MGSFSRLDLFSTICLITHNMPKRVRVLLHDLVQHTRPPAGDERLELCGIWWQMEHVYSSTSDSSSGRAYCRETITLRPPAK